MRLTTNYKCVACNCTAYVPPGTHTVKCSGCGTISSVPPDSGSKGNITDLVRIAQYDLSEGRWAEVRHRCESILVLDRALPEAYYLDLMAVLEVRDLAELENYRGLFLRKREFRLFERYGDDERVAMIRSIGERNLQRERLRLRRFRYNIAMTRYNRAVSYTQYYEAAEAFRRVYDFRDAAFRCHMAMAQGEKLEKSSLDRVFKWFLPYGA